MNKHYHFLVTSICAIVRNQYREEELRVFSWYRCNTPPLCVSLQLSVQHMSFPWWRSRTWTAALFWEASRWSWLGITSAPIPRSFLWKKTRVSGVESHWPHHHSHPFSNQFLMYFDQHLHITESHTLPGKKTTYDSIWNLYWNLCASVRSGITQLSVTQNKQWLMTHMLLCLCNKFIAFTFSSPSLYELFAWSKW